MNQAYRSHLSGDRVRLLFLLPGITGERIKCQTKEVSLSESPQYSAVSYMWGLPGLHSYDIILNDQYFRVQRNLRLVLDCLRLPDEIRILWVDAICINQSDISERNQQVGMMGRIYAQAERVLACLGEADYHSDLAMETLREFDDTKSAEDTSSTTDWSVDSENRRDRLTEVRMLCQRDYWHRTWIIQEVLLANELEIICGGYSVSWRAFAALARELARYDFDSLSPNYVVSSDDRPVGSSGTHMGYDIRVLEETAAFGVLGYKLRRHSFAHLAEVLKISLSSKCKDPRDKVYAVLALVDPSATVRSLVVDYGQSLEQLYLDVMKSCEADYARDTSKDLFELAREFGDFSILLENVLGLASSPSLRSQHLQSMASKRILPGSCRGDVTRRAK